MKIYTFPVGPMKTNCYIVTDGSEPSPSCAVIDPGGPGIKDRLEKKGLTPSYILLTHGHFDHILGLEELRQAYPSAKVMIHGSDAFMLSDVKASCMLDFGGRDIPERPADAVFRGGDNITFGSVTLSVMHTPGHTPGSVCLISDDGSAVFCGDTIFRGGIGRYDLYGGDYGELMASLDKIKALPGDPKLYPGHGSSTTLAREKETNLYLT